MDESFAYYYDINVQDPLQDPFGIRIPTPGSVGNAIGAVPSVQSLSPGIGRQLGSPIDTGVPSQQPRTPGLNNNALPDLLVTPTGNFPGDLVYRRGPRGGNLTTLYQRRRYLRSVRWLGEDVIEPR